MSPKETSNKNHTTVKGFDFQDYFDMGPIDMLNSSSITDVTSAGTANEVDEVPHTEHGFVVGMYSVLLVVGGVGNIVVFTSLVRSRRRKSRVNLMMSHLAVADMIVTFIVIPLEIGWRSTNAWLAGNAACKVFLVLRAFGLYLSSNVLVCISIDRFFAVLYPLRLTVARQRSKNMLYLAWVIALACSLPQSVVFRVLQHPQDPTFEQCVSFGAFSTQAREATYNLFCLCAMYFLPLVLITGCYVYIFCEIATNSKELTSQSVEKGSSRVLLRRSDRSLLERARSRTLRMTVTIVSVFASCWLPYVTMTMWYMFDRQSVVAHVPKRVQDIFFIMAVSNSCMNPLVYGSYNFGFKQLPELVRCCCCVKYTADEKIIGITALTRTKGNEKYKKHDAVKGRPVLISSVALQHTWAPLVLVSCFYEYYRNILVESFTVFIANGAQIFRKDVQMRM